MYPRLGIDIGGTGISAVVVNASGQVQGRASTLTSSEHGGDAMVAACREVAVLATDRSGLVPLAVGVGAADVIDADGVVLAAGDFFTGWAGYPLREKLHASLALPITVGNDVAAFVLGEQRYGVGKGLEHFLGIASGTGAGGGLVLDSVLYAGEHGAAPRSGTSPALAIVFGACGHYDHLETIAAGRSISSLYFQVRGKAHTAKEFAGGWPAKVTKPPSDYLPRQAANWQRPHA